MNLWWRQVLSINSLSVTTSKFTCSCLGITPCHKLSSWSLGKALLAFFCRYITKKRRDLLYLMDIPCSIREPWERWMSVCEFLSIVGIVVACGYPHKYTKGLAIFRFGLRGNNILFLIEDESLHLDVHAYAWSTKRFDPSMKN